MRKHVFVLGLLLFVMGCAAPADMNSMVVSTPSEERTALPDDLRGVFTVTKVGGGEETNPLWTSEVDSASFRGALERSLEAVGFSNTTQPPKHGVEAYLKSVDQPIIGFDMTVSSTVNYVVRDLQTNDVWFEDDISASYTATMSEAVLGFVRLKKANEGSIRENISVFINEMTARMLN